MCRAQLGLEDAFSREMRFNHTQSKNGKAQIDEAERSAQQLFSRLLGYITHTHTHTEHNSAPEETVAKPHPTNQDQCSSSCASSPPALPAQHLDPETRIIGDSDQTQELVVPALSYYFLL